MSEQRATRAEASTGEGGGRRILLAGVPRGGTTWVAEALGAAPHTVYVHEPDNWAQDPFAHLSQREVGRFPVLAPGARAWVYDLLWTVAMRGGWPGDGTVARAREQALRLPRRLAVPALVLTAAAAARRSPEHRTIIAKTVLGLGALEWLADRHADAVLIVRARPVNVASSWRSLGWGPGYLDDGWFARHRPDLLERAGGWPRDEVGQVALAVAGLTTLIDEAAARNSHWVVVAHEDLCLDPGTRFRSTFDRLGLRFTAEVDAFLTASDAPGDGHVVRRITSAQPERWRRLPAEELARVEEIVGRLGLAP